MFRIRLKKIALTMFFIGVFLNSSLWGLETDIPLPAEAVQTLEDSINIGPTKSHIKSYTTTLSGKELKSFFDQEMVKAGWRKEKGNFFVKDDYFAIISILNFGNKDNKTRFSVSTARIPKQEEILASRKSNPDKVNFMPIYPGSTQSLFWDLPTGATGAYETKSSIKDVVFFYKSGMLNYGWSLANEIPLKIEKNDCPECKKVIDKFPAGSPKLDMKSSSGKASLVFRRGHGENCKIDLYQNILDLKGDPALADSIMDSAGKTTILVTYFANKKINP